MEGKMKRILYFVLLIAELFVGTLFMISLLENGLYIPIAIVIVAMAVLLTWQIRKLLKTTDSEMKRKIRVRIALIMLIPSAVFVITYIFVGIVLVIAFSIYGF